VTDWGSASNELGGAKNLRRAVIDATVLGG